MAKLWHDDVRPAPYGWAWAKTNRRAKELLALHFDVIDECSLDYDLGAEPRDGLDLVRWMCKHSFVPVKVTIHSCNTPGATAMADYLLHHAPPRPIDVILQPYEVKE